MGGRAGPFLSVRLFSIYECVLDQSKFFRIDGDGLGLWGEGGDGKGKGKGEVFVIR